MHIPFITDKGVKGGREGGKQGRPNVPLPVFLTPNFYSFELDGLTHPFFRYYTIL